jgi:hypothetical protein
MHSRRLLAISVLAICGAISVPAQEARPTPAQPAASPQPRRPASRTRPSVFARIHGTAVSADSQSLSRAAVRLRDARYGRIVGTLLTDDDGLFDFRSVDPGTYVVELLDERRDILAASQLLSLNAADVASIVVREPLPVVTLTQELNHSAMHVKAVTSAAAATGVLATQVPGDDVSPR